MFKRYMIVLWISAGVSGLIFWFNGYRMDQFLAFSDQQREEEEVVTEEFLQVMGRYQEAKEYSLDMTAGILLVILVSTVARWTRAAGKSASENERKGGGGTT